MMTGPLPNFPREAISSIVQEVMKRYPGETYSTAEVEQLQKELYDEVKASLEKEGYTFDPHHFSRWQTELWAQLEKHIRCPTLLEHILEDD